MTERITVTLPSELADTLRRTVAGGEYASPSEVVVEALDAWSRRRRLENHDRDAARAAIRAGEESGPPIPAAEVFDELRAIVADARRRS